MNKDREFVIYTGIEGAVNFEVNTLEYMRGEAFSEEEKITLKERFKKQLLDSIKEIEDEE